MFAIDERLDIIEEVIQEMPNVSMAKFEGLLARYMEQLGAKVIVKGLRAISDFEYELEMAHLNRQLNQEIETTFIMTATRWSYVSSTRIKELAMYKGDIKKLVPRATLRALEDKFGEP